MVPDTLYHKGLVDLDAEIAKCDKKLTLARLNLEKVMKIVSQSDYAETVPSAVQIANDEKVALLFIFDTNSMCANIPFLTITEEDM
jgi:hypothetical protein